MKKTILAATFLLSAQVVLAEKYVLVEDDIVVDLEGITSYGRTVYDTATTTQSRMISCSQLRREAAALDNIVSNMGTDQRGYAARYKKMEKYNRQYVYECT